MLLPKTKKIAKLGIRRLGLCSCCVPMSYLPNLSESESVSLSVVSDSLWPHSLSMEVFRQEYWSGLPFPSPGDLPASGIKPGSLALQGDFFYHLSYQGRTFLHLCNGNSNINLSNHWGRCDNKMKWFNWKYFASCQRFPLCSFLSEYGAQNKALSVQCT